MDAAKKEPDGEDCARCRFYKGTDVRQGICRKNPPKPALGGFSQNGQPAVVTIWPAVRDVDWCGGWISINLQ